ncbi:MAG: aminotransferase class III-fold pyridoxal phosphate-dependent enzyme [Alphaproteobacteria bacterium]|nr:aminotransferase class III-fold pyridoxal phosphate-dependent enzyme [Alphaproteobacteria bacterium]
MSVVAKRIAGSSGRYSRSEELLARAEKTIPLGSQTFSKSRTQFPYGISPYFIERGEGGHVFDVDGNEYVDFINGLAAVTLGYNDPDVTAAVRDQLENGVIFSLAHPIEMQVAEKVVEMVPCAEKVRFGKNGSDATAGAVRLARAYTGRDHVLACGYHGWQDWYIGATPRHKGVPQAVRDMTHMFPYDDLGALDKLLRDHNDEVAAIILEPMNVREPSEGYLQGVKELAHRHGALLIFDEIVTGFRLANGGAQEYFGVTPDLATFGKGLANGYPVSAIAGRADLMDLFEEVYFSFTFGGETLSLAAALATMTKLQREPVVETMARRGKRLNDAVRSLIAENGLQEWLSVTGHPAWSFLQAKDHKKYDSFVIKTFFLQEMMEGGILTLGSHLLSYAHTEKDIDRFISVYGSFLEKLKEALARGDLEDRLKCEPLRPLFKVR